MLKNITIQKQLLSIPIIVVISFIVIYFFTFNNLANLEAKSQKASQANKMIKNMLESRINEKNYVRRKKIEYAQNITILMKENIDLATSLEKNFKDSKNKELAIEIKKSFQDYILQFNNFKTIKIKSLELETKMLKEARDIEKSALILRSIQKEQRDLLITNKAPIQSIVNKIKKSSSSNKIIKELLTIRIAEKNYIRRKDISYVNEIFNGIENIKTIALSLKDNFKSHKNRTYINEIISSLVAYENIFTQFSTLREESIKISSDMKNEARNVQKLIVQMRKEQKQQKEQISIDMKMSIIYLFIFVAISLIFFSLFMSRMISKNLKEINDAADNLASGEGDLTKRINIESNNEIGQVAKSINRFIIKVQRAISEAKSVSTEAASISNELSATSLEIGKRVEDEASLVNTINEDTVKTTSEAEFVDDTVKKMHEISDKSFNDLQETTQKINSLINTVKTSSIKEEELADKMQDLKNSTNDVKSILELIGDIAEQTNLLSLNAAIEAARAGEHGRGFAVVADEVRKLAEGTQKSLIEINSTINIVTQAVEEASDNMQENSKEIAEAASQAIFVEESIDKVMSSIQSTKEMAMESSNAVDNLKGSMINISNHMKELNDVSTSNARSVEEIASAAEHQNNIIEKLNSQLSSFKS